MVYVVLVALEAEAEHLRNCIDVFRKKVELDVTDSEERNRVSVADTAALGKVARAVRRGERLSWVWDAVAKCVHVYERSKENPPVRRHVTGRLASPQYTSHSSELSLSSLYCTCESSCVYRAESCVRRTSIGYSCVRLYTHDV